MSFIKLSPAFNLTDTFLFYFSPVCGIPALLEVCFSFKLSNA
ncbi:hypothetical protein PRUB_a2137 [Pseudoalteromonas rubra]|uniref:Uncharacterized protein n=1 Tax=Pseudoalteromonas rubra TaxID=43658 RepID=A0A8T0CI16_9GAMM|nr:hypothetical protein PRUB_a2137 [Pseudoalteromonas rubra]